MRLNRVRHISFLCLFIFGIGFSASFLSIPRAPYRYNLDAALSTVGMLISKTYLNFPDHLPQNFQGYIENGEYVMYKNWPPLSFRVLAGWFKILNTDTVLSARIFSCLIYGVTGLLIYLLFLRLQYDNQVSIFASLVFILLPSHLDFSSLIYADIWINFFWSLALLILTINRNWRIWIFVPLLIIGTFFHWFIIFLLIGALMNLLFQKWNLGIKHVWALALLVGMGSITMEYIIIYHTEFYILSKIERYSIFGFFLEPWYYLQRMLKRILSVGYEIFFIVPLIYSIWRSNQSNIINSIKGNVQIIMLPLFIALLLYLMTFTNWFFIHRHGLAMLAIPIAFIAAQGLSILKKKSKKSMVIGGLGSLILCVSLYINIPMMTDDSEDIRKRDQVIIEYMESKHSVDSNGNTSFFLDLEARADHKVNLHRFAIAEMTGFYPFQLKYFNKERPLREIFSYGFKKLEDSQIKDYDSTSFFLISENAPRLAGMTVFDSTRIGKYDLYHLGLK